MILCALQHVGDDLVGQAADCGSVGFSRLVLSVHQIGAIDSVVAWYSAKFGKAPNGRLVEGIRDSVTYRWFHSVR